jgi:hypothetical protein
MRYGVLFMDMNLAANRPSLSSPDRLPIPGDTPATENQARSAPTLDVESEVINIEALLRALICTLEHPGFAEEQETMDRLAMLMEEKLNTLKRKLGIEGIAERASASAAAQRTDSHALGREAAAHVRGGGA